MRRFVPLMAVTLLGGCAAIPPAVGFASYALDGISLLASGRTVSDHVISAATEQDCKLFRMVQNLEVCTDWGTDPQIAEARPMRSPVDRDDGRVLTIQAAGILPVGPMRPVAERDEPMVLPVEFADVAKALPGVARVEAVPSLAAALVPPTKATVALPAAAPWIDTRTKPAKMTMTALVPAAPAALPSPEPDLAAVVRSDDSASRRDAVRAAYEGRYLMVLGSFKGPEMAGRLARLHAGAKVVKAEAQGETYYRVVIEPERGARLAPKLDDKPWLMPAAQGQQVRLSSTLR